MAHKYTHTHMHCSDHFDKCVMPTLQKTLQSWDYEALEDRQNTKLS